MRDQFPNRTVDDPYLQQALRIISAQFGHDVSVVEKAKNTHKFGRNPAVGTAASGFTLWATGQDDAHETYATILTNPIDSISSGSAADTEPIVVQGHTSTSVNGVTRKTYVTQEVTLTGQTRAALTTPLHRVQRAYNSGTADLAGEVYIYENGALTAGKPNTTTDIHLTILSGNQSDKCALANAYNEYYIVTQMHAAVLEKTAASAELQFQVCEQGKVFRTIMSSGVDRSASEVNFWPYQIVPKNADIRLIAVASGAGTDVSGALNGFIATVQ